MSGTVADSTGALIPGAEVTATDDASGMAMTSLTDGVGQLRVFSSTGGLYGHGGLARL